MKVHIVIDGPAGESVTACGRLSGDTLQTTDPDDWHESPKDFRCTPCQKYYAEELGFDTPYTAGYKRES